MALRDDLLPIVDAARKIPDSLGFRRYSVVIRRRSWPGGTPGSGTPVVTDMEITPRPKVRVLSTEEIASSGGTYREGDLSIERITPQYAARSISAPGGGYLPTDLDLIPAANEDVAVILTGDEGAQEAEVVRFFFDASLRYTMVVRIVRAGVRG